MNGRIFAFYFDLRKYAYIERNFAFDDTVKILNVMQQIIAEKMDQLNAQLYHLQTDTAIYLLETSLVDQIENALRKIKSEVDKYMRQRELPSKLHICVAYGKFRRGIIKLKNNEFDNVFGEIMNKLQKYIGIIESEAGNIELNEGIVVSEEAKNRMNLSKSKKKIQLHNENLYIL